METWDAYGFDLKKLEGRKLIRGEKIPEGEYHLVSDVAVVHEDGGYLLMKRDPGKSFGGMWELTAGGSALEGETGENCARRELLEETGIKAGRLQYLGTIVREEHRTIYMEYLCRTDADRGSIVMQKGETCDYRWLSAKEVRSLKGDELVTSRIQQFIEELRR